MTITGRMVWEQAMHLLGYTGSDGELSGRDELLPRALAVVNQAAADLWYTPGGRPLDDLWYTPGGRPLDGPMAEGSGYCPLRSLDEPVCLTDRALTDVLPWGVAMLLAQSESDGDSQALMAMMYTAKRAALSRISRREDVLPYPC